MVFNSEKYKKIELFIRNREDHSGVFQILSGGKVLFEYRPESVIFRKIAIDINEWTNYGVCMDQVEISQMYLCGNDDIRETGVRYLLVNNEEVQNVEEAVFKDTPYREQYHFNPFVNWCNDPNGLCWFDGYYHLYFQSNPHEQKWDNMHWGHAVSKDLVHWKHLPYALEPQEEILRNEELTGGAFSGSAVTLEDGIRIFFTRDMEQRGDGSSIRQSQVTAFSRDGLAFEGEKEILPAFSLEGTDVNFRDPKVIRLNGKWYMVIASNYCGKGTILLYSSEDMEQWNFVKPLLQVEQEGVPSLECPDFFPLGSKFVLLSSIMGYRSEYGVYQPVLYHVGEWSEESFTVEWEGVCDFGENFYASQTFEQDGRRILIAWICDWFGEHEIVKHGAYGSLTLPRELTICDRKLLQKPVQEVYDLLGEMVLDQEGGKSTDITVPGNSFYACVDLNAGTSFEIVLYEDEKDYLKLTGNETHVELLSSKNRDSDARYAADAEKIEKVEIFMDRRVVEIYVNDGEMAGTKIFINHTKCGYFRSRFENESSVKRIQVRQVKSIWEK